jgi:uncharacterized protein (TIGR02599 family)
MKMLSPLPHRAGFTLVEILVSTGLVVLISALLVASMSDMSRVWTRSQAQIATFQQARNAFESMTFTLGQATLNPYWRVSDTSRTAIKRSYLRESDLHFLTGPAADEKMLDGEEDFHPTHAVFFQAPLGYSETTTSNPAGRLKYSPLDQMLTAAGYWIQWTDGREQLPNFIRDNFPNWPERWRFRLFEMRQPAEQLRIFDPARQSHNSVQPHWVSDSLAKDSEDRYLNARILSENIIALVLLPKLAERDRANPRQPDDLTDDYRYDSRDALDSNAPTPLPLDAPRKHQLPPIIEVVMIAIDEQSAARTQEQSGATPPGWMSGRFSTVQDVDRFEQDLDTLQQELIDNRINARFFRAEVLLRSSKWSRDPEL